MKLTRPGAAAVMLSAMMFPALAAAAQDRVAVPGGDAGRPLEDVSVRSLEDLRGPRSGDASLLQLAQQDEGIADEGRSGYSKDRVPDTRARERLREYYEREQKEALRPPPGIKGRRLERELLRKQKEALRMRMRVQRNEIARKQEEMRKQQEAIARQQEEMRRLEEEMRQAARQDVPADLFAPQARDATKTWMERNGISPAGDAAHTLALMVQTALALQNFDPGPRDGKVGHKTLAAIAAFQLAFGLLGGADLGDVLATILHTSMTLQGLDPGPAGGLLGERSQRTIASWQDRHAGTLSSLTAAAPAQGGGRWGAIAYSRSRGGWSASSTSGRANRAIAVRTALDRCRKRKWGDNCKEILAFRDECGAFAIGRARSYGVATGRTRSQAEGNALSECRRVDTNCEVRTKLTTCNPAGGPAGETFEAQPLSDFQVTVPAGQREVELCVRDHECEDGDRISVTVNGVQVFSGELYNSWSCQPVPVEPGANPISMFAINGTGFKGACGHADANTGEIRVTGTTSATQSWRHRGGAGSSARIVVQVE